MLGRNEENEGITEQGPLYVWRAPGREGPMGKNRAIPG